MELAHFNNALAGGSKKKIHHSSPKKLHSAAAAVYYSRSKVVSPKKNKPKSLSVKKKLAIAPTPYIPPSKLQYKLLKVVKKITDFIGYKDYKNLNIHITPKKPVNRKVHVKSYNKHSPKSHTKKKDVHVKAYNRHQKIKPKGTAKKIRKVIGYK